MPRQARESQGSRMIKGASDGKSDARASRLKVRTPASREAGGTPTLCFYAQVGLLVQAGWPMRFGFSGRRCLPGAVAPAPLPAGECGRGEQPEDSYQAGFCLGDEDDAKHQKPDACSL